ncbi:hypothetical protein AK830_g11791 [Neonectria ditissima]|uniref:Xylanolytic transcriptional activator regulatory domain-containing protein n=1 Tax=Neonectria ditissima TaxID=78410 RepID=A0A0P7ALD2_9HYPO|nr:hypothetical protein AK830_g11791 [Neonectria ditissima]
MSAVLAGCIRAGRAQSYASLVGARVLQGLGLAFFESITFAIVGDLFHIHEQGKRMAIYVMAQSGIANLPSAIAGKITMDLGWRWVFYLLSLFVGIGWLSCVVFGWETALNRRAIYNLDTNSNNAANKVDSHKDQAATHVETLEKSDRDNNSHLSARVTSGMLTRLFFIWINPAVTWSILMVSFCSVWVIGISLVIAQIFSAPPYLLNTAQLGYIAFGPVISGSIGCIICGALSDPVARWMTKRNNGIYEPEFRLPLMLLLPFVSTIGYFLFGNLITEGKSPVAAAAMWGIVSSRALEPAAFLVVFFSVQVAAVSTGAYIVDSFRDISVEAFIISMTVKNFLWFGFSFVAKDSRSSNPQQPGAPTSESGDVITFMSASESTREESNQPLSDSTSAAADEEVYYPGTPTSFVREPSNQYERTSPTDQEMVDYFTQAIRDIWTQEPATQLDPFTDSMVVGETNFDFFSLDNMESQPAPNELPIFQDQESRPGNGQNQPNVTHTTNDNSESCLFDASSDIVDDLLSTASRTNQDKESQFVVYGMMALSARFSTLSSFDGAGLKERGVPFSRKGRMIYQEMIRGSEPHGPSLKWLQGCILLAYCNQSCQAYTGCDLMAAICTRLAYSLGLHKVDDDPNPSPSREEWICKEEQRRAWWSAWELDAFHSITSRRPFSIDKYRMCVHLPILDEAWFSGTLVESVNLNTDILQCWKSLRDSENQDERAWFLISNFITVQALELCQQRHVPIKDITQVETVVSCFSLLLHERYGGSTDQLLFDEQNYVVTSLLECSAGEPLAGKL